jgi:hypothetical protein
LAGEELKTPLLDEEGWIAKRDGVVLDRAINFEIRHKFQTQIEPIYNEY